MPSIYLLHREPSLYPDPLAFRPERFLETPPGTYTWIPFGGGVRRCLGASFALFEMKTVLRVLAGRARLQPGAPAPARTARRSITFVPAGEAPSWSADLWANVTRRMREPGSCDVDGA